MRLREAETRYRTHWSVGLGAALLMAVMGPAWAGESEPRADGGALDLSDWDFKRDGIVSVEGAWYFRFGELVPATDLSTRLDEFELRPAPAHWGDYRESDGVGTKVGITGLATYVLDITLSPIDEAETLAWLVPDTQAAVRWQIYALPDMKKLADIEIGKVGHDLEMRPQVFTDWISFRPMGAQELRLVGHVSNFMHARGGFGRAPRLGLRNDISSLNTRLMAGAVFMIGLLLIMALYHFILFYQRRSDRASFYFAVFALTLAGWQLCREKILMAAGVANSEFAYTWLTRLEYCFAVAGLWSSTGFVGTLVPTVGFRRFVRVVSVLGVGLLALFLFSPPIFFTERVTWMQLFLLGVGTTMSAYLGYQAWDGHRQAQKVGLAFVVIFVGTVNDILVTHNVVSTPYLSAYSFVAFVLMQSSIISGLAARTYARAKELTENLQGEVRLRTLALEEQTDAAMEAKEESERLREQALRDAEKLRELDKAKTSFFQNISHELRTPLTLILGPLEDELRASPDNQNLDVSMRNTRRLLRLVNQLLDFQKLSAGKLEMAARPLNLARLCLHIGDYFRSASSHKGINFALRFNESELTSQSALWINGESDALEKVIFNYLSNALKYTPEGGDITLALVESVGGVRLEVRDTGPGISEAGQSKLFEVFSQVEESTTRAFEGTGLGLAFVKSLVEALGGSVGVESEVGQGSTFFATFKTIPAPETFPEDLEESFQSRDWLLTEDRKTGEATVENIESLELEGAAASVLVVDDLEDMRELIARILLKAGHQVFKAANGVEALRVMERVIPDLVISDWMMPELSGPGLIEKIREHDQLSGTPIVLLTAKSDDESKVIGAEVGADVFLGKPFNEQELLSVVRNLIHLKAKEREVAKLNDYITQTVLKRYLPPSLVNAIMSGKVSVDKPAELRSITVLFSDLAGFTALSEEVGARAISAFLNEYLSEMNEVIFEHGGTIDKFIGDAIMVLFGAPMELSPQDQSQRAADCALAMQKRMEGVTRNWQEYPVGDLKMRIGLHRGPAVVGNIGSAQRSDYTAIGPTVNIASRIETACSPGAVFVSQAVAQHLSHRIESRGDFELKGVENTEELFEVLRT